MDLSIISKDSNFLLILSKKLSLCLLVCQLILSPNCNNPLINSSSLDRHNYSGESPHKDDYKDEFLNIIDRMC